MGHADEQQKKENILHRASSDSCHMLHASCESVPCERGFALVELLVALAIFGIVTTFVILAYGRVNSELRTTSLAYEVALSFREAQSYGVSVRAEQGEGLPTNEALDSAYGLHFKADIDPESGRSNARNYYTLFVDKWRHGMEFEPIDPSWSQWRYDGHEDVSGCTVPSSECVSVFKIGEGNTITKFCGIESEFDREECNTSYPITEIDVSFKRPNPDAIIVTNTHSDDIQYYKAARIYLRSAQGKERVVEVGTTGQITIK